MATDPGFEFDEVGSWSEIKLEIITRYAKSYSTILRRQPRLKHVYIDGFAGAGEHRRKGSGDVIAGSPLRALDVELPFHHHYLIDLDGAKAAHLASTIGDRDDVDVIEGDCNEVLLQRVFPQVRWEEYRRGLCILDPYGLHLSWDVMKRAGEMRSIDLFLNFPTMDINMNAVWRHPDRVSADGQRRMTKFWGGESWRTAAYRTRRTLFGDEPERVDNDAIAEAFRARL